MDGYRVSDMDNNDSCCQYTFVLFCRRSCVTDRDGNNESTHEWSFRPLEAST